MAEELSEEQLELVEEYEEYELELLYNLIGNLASEYGNKEFQKKYVLGLPNVLERGSQLVKDAREAACREHAKLKRATAAHGDVLDNARWAATIVDVIAAVTITGGIPPFAIAVALGKLADHSLDKLCAEADK